MNRLPMLTHCGGQLTPRREAVAVPAPPATATYTPLSYESFLVRIEKQLAVEGIKIVERNTWPLPSKDNDCLAFWASPCQNVRQRISGASWACARAMTAR